MAEVEGAGMHFHSHTGIREETERRGWGSKLLNPDPWVILPPARLHS